MDLEKEIADLKERVDRLESEAEECISAIQKHRPPVGNLATPEDIKAYFNSDNPSPPKQERYIIGVDPAKPGTEETVEYREPEQAKPPRYVPPCEHGNSIGYCDICEPEQAEDTPADEPVPDYTCDNCKSVWTGEDIKPCGCNKKWVRRLDTPAEDMEQVTVLGVTHTKEDGVWSNVWSLNKLGAQECLSSTLDALKKAEQRIVEVEEERDEYKEAYEITDATKQDLIKQKAELQSQLTAMKEWVKKTRAETIRLIHHYSTIGFGVEPQLVAKNLKPILALLTDDKETEDDQG